MNKYLFFLAVALGATLYGPNAALAGGDLHLVASDGTYLGCITCSENDERSIHNSYGDYGSRYSEFSIWNDYGSYGSRYADGSMCNQYTYNPTYIIDGDYATLDELHITDGAYTELGLTILYAACR